MDNAPAFSNMHPHEPGIPPVLNPEGRCLICGMLVSLGALVAIVKQLQELLEQAEVDTERKVDAELRERVEKSEERELLKTVKYPPGDTRNDPPRFDLWPHTGYFETEPKN